MIRQELPPLAASIKQAVSSTATCSSTTLEDLNLLLADRQPYVPEQRKKNDLGRTKKAVNESTRSTKQPTKRSTKKPTVGVVEILEDVGSFLQPLERFRLATEVVNATLKGLTEAVRAPPSQKPHRLKKPLGRLSSSQGSGSPSPLQPQCVNLAPEVATFKGQHPHRSSLTLSNGQGSGVLALADCSRVAFATLRKFNALEDSRCHTAHLQLETGMSALISKMIALGLDDLATRELRILTRRLTTTNNTAQSPGYTTKSSGEALPTEKLSLVDLLYLDPEVVHVERLALVIASQMQALKLIASRKRPSMVEAGFEHLRLSTSYSPANFILLSVTKNSPGSREKAARQLEILSQTLLSLCPGTSSGEDTIAGDSRRSVPPHLVLKYQLLVLEIRVKWWELSDHRGDTVSEMANPFAKYLRTFSRRSLLAVIEKYEKAKAAYEDFSELMQVNNHPICPFQPSDNSPYLEIYQILANLARDSSHLDEAVQWMMKSVAYMKDHRMSPTRICDALCQASALQLQCELDGNGCGEPSVILEGVIQVLKSDLKGDSVELDELLISISRLRKAAFLAINNHTKNTPNGKLERFQDAVLKYIEIISLSVTFLIRYVGSRPKYDPESKSFLRYQQRRLLVDKLFKPSIETITALARLPISDDNKVWGRVDEALQDCARLSTILETDMQSEEASVQNRFLGESPFIVLSNAYWRRYLKRKQSSASFVELQCYLQKSIRLISERPPFEQISGFLPAKLEKLGALYESSGETTKALGTYTSAIENLIGNAGLREATEDAATKPLLHIFNKDGKYGVFGRILSAYCLAASKASSSKRSMKLVFDETTLPLNERGLLLEEQLRTLISALQTSAPSSSTQSILHELLSSLLAIYNKAEYPIRRLRTVVTLLRVHSAYPSMLSPDVVHQLLQEQMYDASKVAGADEGLQRFAVHLKASLEVCFAMLQPPFAVHGIQSALESWWTLVMGSPNFESVQDRVGDVSEWLNQLRSLADFLGMQGYEVPRASVLRILTNVQGLQASNAPWELIENLSDYSTQVMNLGYSGEAGASLHKAKQYMDIIGNPRYTGIRWYLASARYFLEIGNTLKWQVSVIIQRLTC